jgi:hypothetical protein
MAKQTVNIGSGELAGDGESLRSAFDKINDNFDDLYLASGGIALTDLSVSADAASGGGSLSYNNTTGAFTYTPPDLSGYSTFSGSYTDLADKPTIPADVSDLTDTTTLLFDGDYDNLTNKPTIPADVSDLTDTTTLLFDSDYDNLTNKPTIPADVGDLTDTGGLLGGGGATNMASLTDVDSVDTVASGDFLLYDGSSTEYKFVAFEAEVNGLIDGRTGSSGHVSTQSQYTTKVTTDPTDPTDTAHHVLSNTGLPSIQGASTAWYYGDVVSDPANPTTSVVLDIDSAILTGDVMGDITSNGTSTLSGTVDFTGASVDFTSASVSGLPNDTWATLGDKNGPSGPSQIALGTNAGEINQGANSIAIGVQAGVTNQAATSIVINATGIVLDNPIPESFVVKPVRGLVTANALYYDITTGEISYGATSAYTNSDVDTHLNTGSAGNNEVLSWTGSDYAWVASGGSGLQSRSTVTGTTSSLADAAEADLDITGFKAYTLLTITTDRAARVRLYVNDATRTADAARAEGVDPTSDAGLIAEVITTGADTVIVSPGAYGFNLESSPTTTIPCRVTNKSGSASTVKVDLNILQLEA